MPATLTRAGGSPAPVVKNNPIVKNNSVKDAAPRPEADILFQTYFKSIGPRTYAAQVKRAGNGNHFLVLTEGKRDENTSEIRKTRLFVFSEDFVAFFKMLQEASLFIRANPVSDEVKRKRDRFWAKKATGAATDAPYPGATRKHAPVSTGAPPRSGPRPPARVSRGTPASR